MEILAHERINNKEYNIDTQCHIHYLHIRLPEPQETLKDFLNSMAEESWIEQLDCFTREAYKIRADKTAKNIVEKVKKGATDAIAEQSGEYLVSYAASNGLARQYQHKSIPLAELWKEKSIGNPAFDFHTESPSNIIIFGESKYSSASTPHMKAINQIMRFIQERKDVAELSDLKNFIQEVTARNLLLGKKGFAAAFSVNAKDQREAIIYPLRKSTQLKELFGQTEVYLIGVEI